MREQEPNCVEALPTTQCSKVNHAIHTAIASGMVLWQVVREDMVGCHNSTFQEGNGRLRAISSEDIENGGILGTEIQAQQGIC